MSNPKQAPPSLNSNSHERLVVVHQGAMGDLLLSLPVFDGLASLEPYRRIDFWGRPELLTLLITKTYCGRIASCDNSELTVFFHDELWRRAQVPTFFQGSKGLFIMGQEQSRILAERLQHHLTSPVVWIQSFYRGDASVPVATYLVDQVRAAGWPIRHGLSQVTPRGDEVQLVRDWFHREGWPPARPPILIHPGSGGTGKIWPLNRWWHLIQWLLKETVAPVLVLTGPADEIVRPLAESAKKLGAHLVADISLSRLAAIISQCHLFIGNDSGVTHLAAALGIPTIAIFGPTNPDVWAPRGPNVQVIQSRWQPSEAFSFHPALGFESVETLVLTAVKRALFSISET